MMPRRFVPLRLFPPLRPWRASAHPSPRASNPPQGGFAFMGRLPVYSTQGVSMTDPQSQPSAPMLHFLCGKIGAGKSRWPPAQPARRAADQRGRLAGGAVPGEIHGMDDYVRCAGRLRAVVAPHVRALLDAGLTVVLDFPANTRAQPCIAAQSWRRRRGASTGCISWMCRTRCKARLRARNESACIRTRPARNSTTPSRHTSRRPETMKAAWCSDTAGRRSAGRAAGVQDSGHFQDLGH